MARISKVSYKVKSDLNKTIVLISDLHYYSKKDLAKLNLVLDEIKTIKPDFICIPGDFIDEARVYDLDLFVDYLNKLSKISKIVISIGNHDITIRKSSSEYYNKKLFEQIKKNKSIYLLNNEIKEIGNIRFIGINLGFNYYDYTNSKNEFVKQFNKIKEVDSKKYNILLCHCPMVVTKDEIVDKINSKVDLVLCGHMHGGITPKSLLKILKNRVLISPEKHHFFVKDSYGYIKKKNIEYIITSGVTKLSHSSHISFFDKLYSSEIVKIKGV